MVGCLKKCEQKPTFSVNDSLIDVPVQIRARLNNCMCGDSSSNEDPPACGVTLQLFNEDNIVITTVSIIPSILQGSA
tara:strand:- start:74 stop:304 length:231 start_codon:yes stop_codon:yes gene_type:complete